MFQEPMTALNPVFTIGNQIEETLRIHGRATRRDAREKAIELLESVSVPEPERRVRDYPHQLSGGLRQRALIALALACGPSLLIADEPTTALDVTIQAQILDLLRDLQRRMGLALLLITHDLGVVAEMADRVAVMYAGRIVEEAPVRRLFDDPKHPYTRGLMASMPGQEPGARLKAIQGTVPALGQLPPRLRVRAALPRSLRPVRDRAAGDDGAARRPQREVLSARPGGRSRRRILRTPGSRPGERCRQTWRCWTFAISSRSSAGAAACCARARSCAPSTTCRSRSTKARRSASSASRAAARRPPAAASCG